MPRINIREAIPEEVWQEMTENEREKAEVVIRSFEDTEIAMIRCNPSLSWIQKWRLIRSIRKDQRRKEMMR